MHGQAVTFKSKKPPFYLRTPGNVVCTFPFSHVADESSPSASKEVSGEGFSSLEHAAGRALGVHLLTLYRREFFKFHIFIKKMGAPFLCKNSTVISGLVESKWGGGE